MTTEEEEHTVFHLGDELTFEELYQEIQGQLEAIEARRESVWQRLFTITSSTLTVLTLDASTMPGSTWGEIQYQQKKKPTPQRPKVRYRAHWRKEEIERKIRSL